MMKGDPFDVDIGEVILRNMAITRLSRTKEPRNEGGLEFVAELQEVIQLDRLAAGNDRWPHQLRAGDPSQSALTRAVNKGQLIAKEATASVTNAVNNILDGVI
ncbi:phage baseplate protein [Pseudomonas parakoreensis]